MGLGDEIVAAGQAQRMYDADPTLRICIVGKDHMPRWSPIWEGNPIIAHPKAVANGEAVQKVRNGPDCRPYIVPPFTKEGGWTFNKAFRCGDHVAKIYLTDEERARGAAAAEKYGPYVLVEPFTKHENFRWAPEKWAALVAACPDLTFVQHTHGESVLIPGANYEPATFREACGLIASASVYVRSESGLCHAAAALGCPTVTIFGACMDPEVMGGYPKQIQIVDKSPGSPCGSWLPCQHCAEAMERLPVEAVEEALRAALGQSVAPFNSGRINGKRKRRQAAVEPVEANG